MKHLIILFGMFISWSHLTAQESRWGFGMELGFGSYGLAHSRGNLIQASRKSGYQANILASYRLSDQVILSAGLGSTIFDYDIKNYGPTFGCDHDGMGGYDPYNSFLIAKDRAYGLAIPVSASIYLGKKENQFYLKPGLTFIHFGHDDQRFLFYECGNPAITITPGIYNISSSQWQTELNVGYEFGLDFPYKYLKRIQYRLEFGAKYFIDQAFDSVWSAGSFWSWGGTLGMRYDLDTNKSEID